MREILCLYVQPHPVGPKLVIGLDGSWMVMCGSCADDVRGCLRVGFIFGEMLYFHTIRTAPSTLLETTPPSRIPSPNPPTTQPTCLHAFLACGPVFLSVGVSLFAGFSALHEFGMTLEDVGMTFR